MRFFQGVDIVSVRRIRQALESHGDAFLKRVFTPDECSYCQPRRMKYEHYAARFAAKEAFIKAMKPSNFSFLSFTDIEVRKQETGKPFIHLEPSTREKLALPDDASIELSMSHEREYAIATVTIMVP